MPVLILWAVPAVIFVGPRNTDVTRSSAIASATAFNPDRSQRISVSHAPVSQVLLTVVLRLPSSETLLRTD